MIATTLIAASAAIVFALGALHLFYTFFGSKLSPRDPALRNTMGEVSPVITRETTMWRCWIGFNASHSMGALLYGLIYGYLAIAQSEILLASPYLLVVGFCMLAGLLALCKAYWFRTPFVGIGVALSCYIAGIIVSMV